MLTGSIDSVAKMKAALPHLRKKLNTDAAYFKKVYMHTFNLSKQDGARVLALDTGKCLLPTTQRAADGSPRHVAALRPSRHGCQA